MRSALAVFCAILLPCAIWAQDAQFAQSTPPPQAAPQQSTPLLSPQQLDNLVAPVALYPDPLLGQVLAASTYPLELVEAQQWMQENSSLRGSQLMDAAKQQNWDPSIQAMVAFPDVMTLLTRDIRWTTDLGNAFLAQQSDLMAAVQRMRARAEQNGRLSSNAQESVTTATEDGQSAIQIQPVNPEVVYVPVYNPEYVWGPPVWGYYPPLWYPPVSYGCGFNAGIFLGGFFAGFGGWGGWGGWGWGLGWFGHGLYVNSLFFNHFGFHGYYGGYGARAMWTHDPMHRMGVAYPNRALSARYGNARFAGGRYNAGFANRGFAGNRAGSSFGGARSGAAGYGSAARAGTNNSYRGGINRGASNYGSSYRGSTGNSSGYRGFNSAGRNASPSYGNTRSYAPSNRSMGTYRGGSQGFRSSPSYGGASNYRAPAQSNRGFSNSAPRSMGGSSFRGGGSAPHFSGGGASHFSGGGRSFGGGGGSRGGGGGHPSGGGGHSGGGSRGRR